VLQGYYFEDLSVGQSAELTRTASDEVIRAFAELTGDTNPVHLDQAYAAKTNFGGRVAHGMLAAAYISAVVGTRLPGPGAVYLHQSLRFRRPVRIGDEVTARATVKALDERKGHVTLSTVCSVRGKACVDGEAVVMAPRRPAGTAP
jgi:3-hydroxybutyryl-CoA dehydratase